MKKVMYWIVIIIAALFGHNAFGMKALETKQKGIAKESAAPASKDREEDFMKDAKNYALLKAYIDKEHESAGKDSNVYVKTYVLRYILAPLWQGFYLAFKKKYGTDWDAKKIEAIYLREKQKITGSGIKSAFFDSLSEYLAPDKLDESFFDEMSISGLLRDYADNKHTKKDPQALNVLNNVKTLYRNKFGYDLEDNNKALRAKITKYLDDLERA